MLRQNIDKYNSLYENSIFICYIELLNECIYNIKQKITRKYSINIKFINVNMSFVYDEDFNMEVIIDGKGC